MKREGVAYLIEAGCVILILVVLFELARQGAEHPAIGLAYCLGLFRGGGGKVEEIR